MTLFRRRLAAASLLGIAAVLGALWLARLDYRAKISTDVLDLLPAAQRTPEIALIRALASETEARVMLFLLEGPGAREAAGGFAAALAAQSPFAEAVSLDDPATRDATGAAVFGSRFDLLFPTWLAARTKGFAEAGDPGDFASWLAADAAARLESFLGEPGALPFTDLIPRDPLLLVPGALVPLQQSLALLDPPSAGSEIGRVWAVLRDSPLSESAQKPAFDAIASVWETLARHPDLRLRDTGINRFAAASRARIEAELSWLNSVSLAGVLAVAVLFIRRLHRALHLLPPVLFAVLGAWVATTAAFERVHILVFVVGALLTGVAIDYGFYLFMPAPGGTPESYGAKIRRLLKPLLSSCFTAVTGFLLLMLSDLPLIRQLGFFVGCGLVCALGAAILWFALLRNTVLEIRPWGTRGFHRVGSSRRLRLGAIAALVLTLPGLLRISWRDDIRELEIPATALRDNDARIRSHFGQDHSRTVFLTHGATLAEARTALGNLQDWVTREGRADTAMASAGALIPPEADWERTRTFAREQGRFPDLLRAALRARGFDESAFGPFFADYESWRREAGSMAEAVGRWHTGLRGPSAMLLHPSRDLTWFVSIVRHAPDRDPPAEASSVRASQLQSLNRVFTGYRQDAVRMSLIGLAVVGAGVLVCYGWRSGLRIFALPAGTCLGLFGLLGWLGVPLNLFHLLGAFLGVCLTHNYSIFAASSALADEAPPLSIRMSALTTAASFGTLSLSSLPAVRALGITVAAMVLIALAAIELRVWWVGPAERDS